VAEPPVTFAGLLRKRRADAWLTQEELAKASGVPPRTISDLERGVAVSPHRDTVRRLADALRLTAQVRAEFEAVARGRSVSAAVEAEVGATRTLPRDIASFTGRQPELRELLDAAAGAKEPGGVVAIHAIGGMAGVGKTALAVHAAHRLAPRFPAGQIFLPLHGHTPGHRPVEPGEALASLLLTIGIPAAKIPADEQARTALWRDWVAERQLLLVLDDAASSEQVRPLLPGNGGSLVLITSRRHLSALDDARTISLDTLPAGEAAALLARLAGRPELAAADAMAAELARLCGCLPLAIGMVARQLHHHPAWSPRGRAAELTAARDRLELMATENLSVAAAFDLSYADLTDDQQRLFRRLGLHPGGEFDAYAADALDGAGLAAARRGLEALYDQYLLIEPAQGRYRMHDLIREHARSLGRRLDTDGDRERATDSLLDYYQHTAAVTEAMLTRHVRPRPSAAGYAAAPPAMVPDLPDRAAALRWARTEHANVLACLDHVTGAGQHARVVALTAGTAAVLRQDGPWADAITRHAIAVESARRIGDRLGVANALDDLGIVRRLTGDYAGAALAQDEALVIYRALGSEQGQANSLGHLGTVWTLADDYQRAAGALEDALVLYRGLGDREGQADTLNHLGVVRRLTHDQRGAAKVLEEALDIYRALGDKRGQATTLTYLGTIRRRTGDYPGAAQVQQQALDIHRELGNKQGQANALCYLGTIHREIGAYERAAREQEEALASYREIGSRLGQANTMSELGAVRRLVGDYPGAAQVQEQALDIYTELGDLGGQAMSLCELGALHRQTGDFQRAQELLEQALSIFEELDDVAEGLNELGELYRVRGDLDRARACFRRALDKARDVASLLDEARALAGLGHCAMDAGDAADAEQAGRAGHATALLRQALEIFQRIGTAEAQDLLAELDALAGGAADR
jgi:tetratricopeptide (TPR) repeat protein/transcriptional regulator with XRE-family HTH domain